MFSNDVRDFMIAAGRRTRVRGYNGNEYEVELDGNEIKLLDLPYLQPIELDLFDAIEEILRSATNGIMKKGCAREKLDSPKLSMNDTVMGRLGRDYYGLNPGDSMIDQACYIYAILAAAGCIRNLRGKIRLI